ncbi:hypothetical protein D9M68_628480 [compost metagenome]
MSSKFIFFGFVLSIVSSLSYAQRTNFEIGAELNLPAGNSTNISPIGLGFGVKGELGLSPKFSLTGGATIAGFAGKKFYGPRAATQFYLPVKGGLKYYADKSFYVEGQLGARMPFDSNAKTAFIWSPGVGTFLRGQDSKNQIDIGLRYEGWRTSRLIIPTGTVYSTFNFFSLRIAYAFGL